MEDYRDMHKYIYECVLYVWNVFVCVAFYNWPVYGATARSREAANRSASTPSFNRRLSGTQERVEFHTRRGLQVSKSEPHKRDVSVDVVKCARQCVDDSLPRPRE